MINRKLRIQINMTRARLRRYCRTFDVQLDMRRLLAAAIIIVAANGCKSDTILLAPPPDPIVDVSFAAEIDPIFQNSCSGSGCHIGQTTNGVNLSNYQSILNSRPVSYDREAVVPFAAEDSPLIDKIKPFPTFGDRMPRGLPSLSPLEITFIRTWIDEGALDN